MARIESIWRAVERLECEVMELREVVDAHREVAASAGGDDGSEPAWLRVLGKRVASIEGAAEAVRQRMWPMTRRGREARAYLASVKRVSR